MKKLDIISTNIRVDSLSWLYSLLVKIKRKVSSTLEAEPLSIKGASDNAIYVGSLLSEFISVNFKEIKFMVEASQTTNQSNKASDQQASSREKAAGRLLEEVAVQDVEWKPTKFQLVDDLTKRNICINNVLGLT